MNLPQTIQSAILTVIMLATPVGLAFQKSQRPVLFDFDKRTDKAVVTPSATARRAAGSTGQAAAVNKLRERVPEARVAFDELLGTPKMVRATEGFLTGLGGQGRGVSAQTLAQFPAGDPHRVIKAFLHEHRALFSHGPEVLDRARLKRDYITPHNGMRTVAWEQELDGIPVYASILLANSTREEALVNLSSLFIPDSDQAANAGTRVHARRHLPDVSADAAVLGAAQNLYEDVPLQGLALSGRPGADNEQRHRFKAAPFSDEVDARLVWLPVDGKRLRLCWQVELTVQSRGETFRVLVDAQSGEVLARRRLTVNVGNISFRVHASDSPTPSSPGHSAPLTNQPPLLTRTWVTWMALDTNASPKGWIEEGANETRGNNCDAHLDRDADNLPDLPRPQGSPPRVFNPPMDLSQHPTNFGNAAVVQLFFWCNWMHDRLYGLGFTETAGNFQATNFGRGGLGNDAVLADAQDGSGFNNANFTPSPDGVAPRIQMYLFDGPTPWRDGDFDVEIVLHEYTHGLSDRLVGGGTGIDALQSKGLGEGWSDFYPLALLSEPQDDSGGNYALGAYAAYLFSGLRANYYYGIRRYPYSTNFAKNPLTFKDIDPGQAIPHLGVPLSPSAGPFNPTAASEEHNQGEVWCVALWEVRANLIARHGHAIGNYLLLQLVTDGMKLSPPNPTFLQARDAILQADLVNHAGANHPDIWRGFAKRGMGFSASSPASSVTSGVVEAFDLPDDLRITPLAGFKSEGEVGGPFSPTTATYALTNTGTAALAWTLVNTSAWVNVEPTRGTLAPGGPNTLVTVSLTATAAQLPTGIYTCTLQFANQVSSLDQRRTFALRVGQPDFYTATVGTEQDLSYQTLTFTPDGSDSYYAVCRELANAFPTDPAGGNVVMLADDSFTRVEIPGGAEVALYGRRTNVVFIGSNGYVTLGEGDTEYAESADAHFRLPRVSARFDDLNPAAGGTVSWKLLSDRVTVTYLDVREFGSPTHTSSFQIDLFFDGRIRITCLQLSSANALLGLSAGQGVPLGFEESDFRAYAACQLPLLVSLPPMVAEGDGILTGQGRLSLAAPAPHKVAVTLVSSDPTEVIVPATVFLVLGQTSAVFDVTVLDDAELDGTQSATVTATAVNYTGSEATIVVFDNEVGVLSVSLPASTREGDGTVQGLVYISPLPASSVSVCLASSDPTEIQVPAELLVPAGATSAVFAATVLDDTEIDGPQAVLVTATVRNWTDGSAVLTVRDNEILLAPHNPVPADLATEVTATADLSWSSDGEPVTTDVYFGTRPDLGADNLLGTTTNSTWELPQLAPATTYYWKVIARREVLTPGPVWQFSTRGVDHFEWSPVASPQRLETPFPVSIAAKDRFNSTVSNFTGTVSLRGFSRSGGPISTIVISEIQPNSLRGVEFMNVSAAAMDVGGWQISVFDSVSWPEPLFAFELPPGTIVPAQGIFLLQESGDFPGAFPNFHTGGTIAWDADNVPFNRTAVLLRDTRGDVVDFVCAADAFPDEIGGPAVIPPDQWLDAPVAAGTSMLNYQRVGDRDDNSRANWILAAPSLGTRNEGLAAPFLGGWQPVRIASGPPAPFVNGVWTNSIAVLDPGQEILIEARDGDGCLGISGLLDVTQSLVIRLELVGKTAILTWPAQPKMRYRVEWRSTVAESQWNALAEGLQTSAASATATATDTLPSGAQRFYRVVLEP